MGSVHIWDGISWANTNVAGLERVVMESRRQDNQPGDAPCGPHHGGSPYRCRFREVVLILRGLLVPPPSSFTFTELVCNRTFDKYSCWPDTPPNTTANISCPWYLPWYHKGNGVVSAWEAEGAKSGSGLTRAYTHVPVQHRLVFKRCGPDGQWVRGPRGQSWRDASQCQMDDDEIEVQVSSEGCGVVLPWGCVGPGDMVLPSPTPPLVCRRG